MTMTMREWDEANNPPSVMAFLDAVTENDDDWYNGRIGSAEYHRRQEAAYAKMRISGYDIADNGELVALCAY